MFLEDTSPFCGATGDVCPRFQSQGGSLACVLCHLCTMGSSYSPLVRHLLTPWRPAWQSSLRVVGSGSAATQSSRLRQRRKHHRTILFTLIQMYNTAQLTSLNINISSSLFSLLYCTKPFSMTAFRSSLASLPIALPNGGSGAPGAVCRSARAPQVT